MSESVAEVSLGVSSLLAQIETYCAQMAPGKRLTEDQINMQQKGLYLLLSQVLKQESYKDFTDAFLGTVELFKRYREEALSTSLVSRNHYSVRLSTEQRRDFAAWVNVFVIMANDQLRRSLIKQTDPYKAFRALDEVQQERAVGFIKSVLSAEQQA